MNSASELQKAIRGVLAGDAALSALVGDRIHDHAPADVAFPYISFGRTSVYDWSTATETGHEHIFTVHVWSKGRGRKQVLELMELAKGLLHDAALELEGHRLVNLQLQFAHARYEDGPDVYHGWLRMRAVTEEV